MRIHSKADLIGRAVVLALAIPSMAQAVVSTIDASVFAEVNEFENGAALNSDQAFKDLNDSTGALPLVVNAQLLQSDQAGGHAQVTFSDPTVSVLPDPNEFGINVAAYSTSPAHSFLNRGSAQERRDITFLSSEIGAADGTALEAQSFFFVDGIILLWGENGTTDLAGTSAQVTLSVGKGSADTLNTTPVLEAQLTLTGQSDGTVLLSATGGLSADNVALIDLTGAIPEFGPVHLLIIPNTAIPYTYDAAVGQAFQLDAAIEGRIENQPGTGASVLLGVPLLDLASLVNAVSGGSAGTQLQQALEASLASGPAPSKPLIASDTGSTVRITSGGISLIPFACGLLGAETALALASFGAITLVGTNRRKFRRHC